MMCKGPADWPYVLLLVSLLHPSDIGTFWLPPSVDVNGRKYLHTLFCLLHIIFVFLFIIEDSAFRQLVAGRFWNVTGDFE